MFKNKAKFFKINSKTKTIHFFGNEKVREINKHHLLDHYNKSNWKIVTSSGFTDGQLVDAINKIKCE